MTIETPAHVKRVDLPHQGHQINAAMTCLAADSLVDMDTVVEIDEAGKIVNASPVNGLIVSPTRTHRL